MKATMTLWVSSSFEAAHELSACFAPSHPCSRLHGHRYEVRVVVEAPDNGDDIMCDYYDLQKRLREECALLDHRCLNEVMDVAPTVENLCRAFMRRLSDLHPSEVTVQEQPGTGATLRYVRRVR